MTVDPVMDFYPANTPVTLTAVPDPGKFFVRWTGALSSVKNPATFTISSSSPVTARFSDRGVSATVTFWPSEFSQVRGQYRRTTMGIGPSFDEFFLQLQFAIGAHGVHVF